METEIINFDLGSTIVTVTQNSITYNMEDMSKYVSLKKYSGYTNHQLVGPNGSDDQGQFNPTSLIMDEDGLKTKIVPLLNDLLNGQSQTEPTTTGDVYINKFSVPKSVKDLLLDQVSTSDTYSHMIYDGAGQNLTHGYVKMHANLILGRNNILYYLDDSTEKGYMIGQCVIKE